MRVTLTDEFFTPSPEDMADEFWNSDAERQAEILYSLALIWKYNFSNFCNQMAMVLDSSGLILYLQIKMVKSKM